MHLTLTKIYSHVGYLSEDAIAERRLGRTQFKVSILGFGGTRILHLIQSQAVGVVRKAFDYGINYTDTAKLDGNS